MYESFFNLEDAPFVLTPDPRFLFRAKRHHEILSTLLYGITSQKGLMALIGDVGTGKTLLCRALLKELPREVRSALILNPYLSETELVGNILDDLGVARNGASRGELMTTLSQYLLEVGKRDETVVVIVDEAQQMSVAALEQIRILSTLETDTRKLLQVVLVGQPELEEKLALRELRQLDQRIGIRCYLVPLSRADTARYVEYRLRVAGLLGKLPFTRAALAQLFAYSGGVPRLINLVCDRALMAACSQHAQEVTPAMVKTAIQHLEGEHRRGRREARKPWAPQRGWRGPLAAGLVGVLVLGVAAAAGYWSGWRPSVPHLFAKAGAERTRTADVAPAPRAAPIPPGGQAGAATPAPQTPALENAELRRTIDRADLRPIMAQSLKLWGVADGLSEQAMRAWPAAQDGRLDIDAVAARYQLSATRLQTASLPGLRAVGLPALVELSDRVTRYPYLLRWLGRERATLVGPDGAEARVTVDVLEAAWTHSAWILWRNPDGLPARPDGTLSPSATAAVSSRLWKLGHLSSPTPAANPAQFRQAVRRFQRAVGLDDDGVVGPMTTLALARATGGPGIVEDPGTRP